ncbi:MAG TPA: enoyl-CoA hydratase [Stellaceae bacterium]|nr:enoyl-CoA hydratase [Stellaceae bacterium]
MPETHGGRIVTRVDARPGGRVAFVAIDNRARLNSLTGALMDELAASIAALGDDAELRALVLTGAGDKAFIGGADIDEMSTLADADAARTFITRLHAVCAAIRALPVPVIARINGFALGAGLEIAASCDLRIAAESAVFGMPEVRLGIPSVIEAALLPRLIGWGRARQVVLFGENFPAADALSWGLVEELAGPGRLDAVVEAWLARLFSCAPGAVRRQKQLIRAWEDLPLRAAIAAGIDSFADAIQSGEPAAVMGDFLARRKARR